MSIAIPEQYGSLRLAIEYLRVSKDKQGRQRSTGEQGDDNRRNCEMLRASICRTYLDTIGASRHSQGVRDDFARLIADIDSGVLDGHLLIIWEVSRGSRRVDEWAPLITKLIEHKINVYETSSNTEYDTENPRHIRQLLEEAIDSQYEVDKLRVRVMRAVRANAAEGRPHGTTPYGYERVYHPINRSFIEQRPHLSEAPVVERIFKHVLAGGAIYAIVRTLNAEGVPSPKGGKEWKANTIRMMLRTIAYHGKRSHEEARGGQVQITDAVWPALVDDPTWYGVQRIMDDPARKNTRPSALRHWLSGVILCGECGKKMQVTLGRNRKLHPTQTRDMYRCTAKPTACTTITKPAVEALVEELILGKCSDPRWRERLLSGGTDDKALLDARAEVGRLRAQLDELYDRTALPRGHGQHLSLGALARLEPRYKTMITAAEAKVVEVTVPPQLREFLADEMGTARQWERMGVAARRDVAATLMKVRVAKRRAGRSDYLARLDITWLL